MQEKCKKQVKHQLINKVDVEMRSCNGEALNTKLHDRHLEDCHKVQSKIVFVRAK